MGPLTEQIIETDSNKLSQNSMPMLKTFPEDAGRFITFGMTVKVKCDKTPHGFSLDDINSCNNDSSSSS